MVTGAGFVVRAGLVHTAAARRLVHNLKYRGLAAAARVLAAAMADRLEGSVAALVPLPRAHARRIRYGIDPARELALAVGRQCGVPVVDALLPSLWWPRHAPREPGARRAPRFRLSVRVPEGVVLIDDVVRTGSTMAAAAGVLGVRDLSGLVATAPGTISTTGVAFLREAAQR